MPMGFNKNMIDPAALAAAVAAGSYGVMSSDEHDSAFLRGLMFGIGGGILGKITPGYRDAFNAFKHEASKAVEKELATAGSKVNLL